ncbi:MAG: RAMP superfamily CRISPR-associated protein [Cyanobacteria bacterium P01_G01_bin.38]
MIQLSTLTEPTSAAPQDETISLTAIIETALCVGAGGSSGSLADKPILKNAEGRLVIPASQLKGRLRHECEKLVQALGWPTCESPVAQRMCPQRAGLSENKKQQFNRDSYRLHRSPGDTHGEGQTHCLICQLFGNPALPARLQFSDLVCTEPAENIPDVLRPGVTINRRRRTAEEKKLYFLETSPANLALKFEGSLLLHSPWRLTNENTENLTFAKALIVTGLKHIYALGGGKSTGLGWLHWEFDKAQMTISDEAWGWLRNADEQPPTEQTHTPEGGA